MALNKAKKVEPLAATPLVDSTLPVSRVRPTQREGLSERLSGSYVRLDLTKVSRLGPILERMLKSRRFQFYFILPTQIIFWLVVISGIFGTLEPSQNFGTAITWSIWFALMFLATILIVRPIAQMAAREKAKEPVIAAPVTTKECPFCFTQIPVKASRCRNCTSQLTK